MIAPVVSGQMVLEREHHINTMLHADTMQQTI